MLKWRRGPTQTLAGLTILPGGVLLLPDGAVGAPSIGMSNEPTTGFYRSTSGSLRVAILGNNYHIINQDWWIASDAGRVLFGDSGDTNIARDAANTLTTGVLNLLTPVLTYASDQVLTAALCKNSLITVTATATITLPAVTGSGMCVCIYSTTAAVVHVDANANDRIVLDGTALDDGDKVTCDAVAGNWIVLFNDTNVGWRTLGKQGVWVDGGA